MILDESWTYSSRFLGTIKPYHMQVGSEIPTPSLWSLMFHLDCFNIIVEEETSVLEFLQRLQSLSNITLLAIQSSNIIVDIRDDIIPDTMLGYKYVHCRLSGPLLCISHDF